MRDSLVGRQILCHWYKPQRLSLITQLRRPGLFCGNLRCKEPGPTGLGLARRAEKEAVICQPQSGFLGDLAQDAFRRALLSLTATARQVDGPRPFGRWRPVAPKYQQAVLKEQGRLCAVKVVRCHTFGIHFADRTQTAKKDRRPQGLRSHFRVSKTTG